MALNFARSRFLRRRTNRCDTDLNSWSSYALNQHANTTEQGTERPLQIYVYNCANFALLEQTLAKTKNIALREKKKLLFHGTTWTHARSAAKGINIDCALPHSEFSANGAFYLTDDWHQAHLHAVSKTTILGNEDPAVLMYVVAEDAFANRKDHLKLQEDPHLWRTVVARCRDPDDTHWIQRWDTFASEYQSIEGPMPGESDPDEDPIPKRNTWQLALIGETSAKRMDGCKIGIIVWGDGPMVLAQPAAGHQTSVDLDAAKKNATDEVIDADVDMNISPTHTPMKKMKLVAV